MSINVHIERLILDGLSVTDAQSPIIGAAVERELARLLARGGLERSLQSGGAWATLPVEAVQLTSSKPSQLGQQIAQAVYGGIGLEPSPTSGTKAGSPHVGQK
jgi:hypothetical protein